jgi:hypothetical protein
MELLDSPFPIGSLKELKGENIVSYKDFKNRLKERSELYRFLWLNKSKVYYINSFIHVKGLLGQFYLR